MRLNKLSIYLLLLFLSLGAIAETRFPPVAPYNYRAPIGYYPPPYRPLPVEQNRLIDKMSPSSSELEAIQSTENYTFAANGIERIPMEAEAAPQQAGPSTVPLSKVGPKTPHPSSQSASMASRPTEVATHPTESVAPVSSPLSILGPDVEAISAKPGTDIEADATQKNENDSKTEYQGDDESPLAPTQSVSAEPADHAEESGLTVKTATTEVKGVKPAPLAPLELPLAERLHRAQPQIEQAIKNGDFAEAYYLWRPLAEAGDASAQYGIGWMYHNGYGLSIDDQKAYDWWSKAAAQNYTEAIFSIGTLYQFGYGSLKKDNKIALGYYLMATVSGHEESRLILKTRLESGDKTIKPILSALLLYHLHSTISGNGNSATILNRMLLENDPRIEPVLSKLLNYHLNTAIGGDSESSALLAQMVLDNDSRITNILPKLLTHYLDSAISGDKESRKLLRTMMLNGDKRAENIVAELLKSDPTILGNIPAKVRVKRANTRMGPGTQHKIIKVVKQGDELMVIDQEDGWLLAQLNDSDKRVWISARLVNLNP